MDKKKLFDFLSDFENVLISVLGELEKEYSFPATLSLKRKIEIFLKDDLAFLRKKIEKAGENELKDVIKEFLKAVDYLLIKFSDYLNKKIDWLVIEMRIIQKKAEKQAEQEGKVIKFVPRKKGEKTVYEDIEDLRNYIDKITKNLLDLGKNLEILKDILNSIPGDWRKDLDENIKKLEQLISNIKSKDIRKELPIKGGVSFGKGYIIDFPLTKLEDLVPWIVKLEADEINLDNKWEVLSQNKEKKKIEVSPITFSVDFENFFYKEVNEEIINLAVKSLQDQIKFDKFIEEGIALKPDFVVVLRRLEGTIAYFRFGYNLESRDSEKANKTVSVDASKEVLREAYYPVFIKVILKRCLEKMHKHITSMFYRLPMKKFQEERLRKRIDRVLDDYKNFLDKLRIGLGLSKKGEGVSEGVTASGMIASLEVPLGLPLMRKFEDRSEEDSEWDKEWEELKNKASEGGYLSHPLIFPKEITSPFYPLGRPYLFKFLKNIWFKKLVESEWDFGKNEIKEKIIEHLSQVFGNLPNKISLVKNSFGPGNFVLCRMVYYKLKGVRTVAITLRYVPDFSVNLDDLVDIVLNKWQEELKKQKEEKKDEEISFDEFLVKFLNTNIKVIVFRLRISAKRGDIANLVKKLKDLFEAVDGDIRAFGLLQTEEKESLKMKEFLGFWDEFKEFLFKKIDEWENEPLLWGVEEGPKKLEEVFTKLKSFMEKIKFPEGVKMLLNEILVQLKELARVFPRIYGWSSEFWKPSISSLVGDWLDRGRQDLLVSEAKEGGEMERIFNQSIRDLEKAALRVYYYPKAVKIEPFLVESTSLNFSSIFIKTEQDAIYKFGVWEISNIIKAEPEIILLNPYLVEALFEKKAKELFSGRNVEQVYRYLTDKLVSAEIKQKLEEIRSYIDETGAEIVSEFVKCFDLEYSSSKFDPYFWQKIKYSRYKSLVGGFLSYLWGDSWILIWLGRGGEIVRAPSEVVSLEPDEEGYLTVAVSPEAMRLFGYGFYQMNIRKISPTDMIPHVAYWFDGKGNYGKIYENTYFCGPFLINFIKIPASERKLEGEIGIFNDMMRVTDKRWRFISSFSKFRVKINDFNNKIKRFLK